MEDFLDSPMRGDRVSILPKADREPSEVGRAECRCFYYSRAHHWHIDQAVREQLAKTGMLKLIGEENVFLATPQLGEAIDQAAAAALPGSGKSPAEPAGLNPALRDNANQDDEQKSQE